MNIFYVDKDPVKAAQMLLDKHVVKMILESAQMLCTAKRVLDGKEYFDKTKNGRKIRRWKLDNSNEEAIIYKAGWLNHPSTQWVLQSAYNYIWLYKHMMALNEEYKLRYNHTKDHLTIQKLGDILKHPPKNAKVNVKGTDATPAMPDECKVPGDVVASYRKYYIMKKQRFATWKSPAKMPVWFAEGIKQYNSNNIAADAVKNIKQKIASGEWNESDLKNAMLKVREKYKEIVGKDFEGVDWASIENNNNKETV